MTGRVSLASQLAAIRDVAPAEYDPEAAAANFEGAGGSDAQSRRDLDAGRSDYLDVGESKLRKNLDVTDLGGRYAGVKSSRSELYSQANGEQSATGSENGAAEDNGEDAMSDGSEDDFSEEVPAMEEDGEQDGEEQDDSIPSEAEEDEPAPTKTAARARQPKTVAPDDDSRQMIQELKKASSVEVEKGRAVRKQLSFWDTLLEARIRLQKCVTSMNVLPESSAISSYTTSEDDQVISTIGSLEELSELLFRIRSDLYSTNEHLQLPATTRHKRKRGTADYADASIDDNAALTTAILPHERSTISKWSDKVSAATGGAASQQNKFKAIGTQNTLAQIDTILSQDMERLVERSRVRRGGQGVVKVIGRNEALQPVEGEKDISKDIYDDTDFYQALLREVVDSTSGLSNGMPGTAGAYASFNQISRKKLANVDPKASKGRKLRYHVHEKLQNFMTPIPTLTWEKEQTDELFRGLLGGIGRQDVEVHGIDDSDSIPQLGGQLRIF